MTSAPVLRVAALSLLALAVPSCSDANGANEDLGISSSAITPIPGCDYSFARPSPASLSSMGYKFAARYLSGDPGSGKDLSASEATSLTGGGLDIVLVWESTGTDATDGFNQGVSDATAAKSEAVSVGQPATRPIYFAIDFDAEASDASSINAYFQGVASVIGLSRTGVYGGYYIVDELFNAGLVKFAWQTYAWSGGSWDSRAQLRQTQNGVDGDQLDADTGMVDDYGQWGPGAPTGTAEYAAQFVSQSFPLAATALDMTEGQTIPSYIELKNVGTKTWDTNTHLGTTQPRDRASVFADSTWLSPDRPAGVTGTVPPGSTYKFKFDLHAPSSTGTFLEYFGVVEDGVAWFSDPGQGGPVDNDLEVQVVVSAPEYRGIFVSQTYPAAPAAFTMHVGETSQGSMTLKNSGTKAWVAGTTKLAPIPRDTASPFATSTWLSPTRVSSVASDVQPGASGTFALSLTATKLGDFEVELGLVEEGLAWFADAPTGGGPADGFLRVHVSVVAGGDDASDAGESDTDADAATSASVDGGDAGDSGVFSASDAGISTTTTDAGAKRHDAGHLGQPAADGGDEQAEVDSGASASIPASIGGCSVGHGESPAAPMVFVGLMMIVLRRRTRRSV